MDGVLYAKDFWVCKAATDCEVGAKIISSFVYHARGRRIGRCLGRGIGGKDQVFRL